MNGFRLYFRYIGVSLRSQMQYKASLAMLTVGYSLGSIVECLGIFVLFGRFGGMGDWALNEIAMFYGMSCTVFSLCEGWMRGFFIFSRTIQQGEFDRVLVRPRSTILQVQGTDFQLLRLGRSAVGIVVLAWGYRQLGLSWTPADWTLLIFSMLGGGLLFSGIVLLQATCCFWTVETLEIFNMFTYGGVEVAHYPVDIYNKWLRRFFMYLVPVAAVNYWPLSVLLGKGYAPPALAYLSPLIGVAFYGIGIFAWRFGVKRYRSTGS